MNQPIPTIVIKQRRQSSEPFDPEKLHRSLVATCRSVRTPDGQAEEVAGHVVAQVINWCRLRPEVTAADLRRQAVRALTPLHADAAYVYKNDKTMM